jgi:hypothetical protein
MAATAPKPPDPLEYAVQRAIVLRSADADVVKLLRQAQQDVIRMLREVANRPAGIGRDVREAQLRLVQRNLHLELGKVWRQLNNVTEARRAEAAARSIDYTKSLNTFKLVTGGVPDGKQIADAIAESEAANAASGIDRMIARASGASYVPLKDRVYNSEVNIGSQVDRMVNSALVRGLSASEFAKEVRGFINPATPGGVRYASMRLARTEINNAAHAMAVESVRDTPWVEQMEWRLSGSHGRPDVCDQLAKGGTNNDGKYPKRSVPAKPHPQCLCYVIATTVSDEEFEDNLLSGKYNQYLEKYRNIPPGTIVRSNFGGGIPQPAPKTPGTKPVPKPKPVKPTEPVAAPVKNLAAENKASEMIQGGVSLPTARRILIRDHGLTEVEAEKVLRAKALEHPNTLLARQAKITARYPTQPAGSAAATPKPISTLVPREPQKLGKLPSDIPDDLRAKLRAANKFEGRDAALIQQEMEFQATLVPDVARLLDEAGYHEAGSVILPGTGERVAVNGQYFRDRTPIPGQQRLGPLRTRILISRSAFTEQGAAARLRSQVTGFKAKCGHEHESAQQVFAHEFGHHLDYTIRKASVADQKAIRDALGNMLGVPGPDSLFFVDLDRWVKQHNDRLKVSISGYGATNALEMMAEVWAEYSTNSAARSHIKVIGEALKRAANNLEGR